MFRSNRLLWAPSRLPCYRWSIKTLLFQTACGSALHRTRTCICWGLDKASFFQRCESFCWVLCWVPYKISKLLFAHDEHARYGSHIQRCMYALPSKMKQQLIKCLRSGSCYSMQRVPACRCRAWSLDFPYSVDAMHVVQIMVCFINCWAESLSNGRQWVEYGEDVCLIFFCRKCWKNHELYMFLVFFSARLLYTASHLCLPM